MPDRFSAIMAPAKRPTYFTVDGCLSQDSGEQIEVLEVKGLDSWSDAELTWKVAWPETDDRILRGSGRGTAPDTFEALPSQGNALSCTSGEASPVLAVEFPLADTEHIGFDSLRVRYKVGDDEYETIYGTRVGICALNGGGDLPSACAESGGD